MPSLGTYEVKVHVWEYPKLVFDWNLIVPYQLIFWPLCILTREVHILIIKKHRKMQKFSQGIFRSDLKWIEFLMKNLNAWIYPFLLDESAQSCQIPYKRNCSTFSHNKNSYRVFFKVGSLDINKAFFSVKSVDKYNSAQWSIHIGRGWQNLSSR